MTDLLVLHDIGGPGGGEWAEAFDGWPGRVLTPDLPGHNGTPPPVGGQYDTGDAAYVALDLLRADPPDRLLVVGIGHSGAVAQVLALGGRTVGLVLVDGLGGPWLDAADIDARQREMRRRVLSTPAAIADPAPGTTDARATMVVGAHDRTFAVRQAEAMSVPVLVVETPSSPTPDAADIAGHFADASLTRVDGRDPAGVASAVGAWWAHR